MHDSIRTPGRGAQTFLVHLLGGGLADIRYAVTHFRSRADGDIVPIHPNGTAGKGKPRPSIMTLDKVRALCPGRDEIIIGYVATPPLTRTSMNRLRFPRAKFVQEG